MVNGTRGGIELHAPTYDDIIANVLMERGLIEANHVNAACDYLELKNSVYGFLNAKTMSGLLKTGEVGFKRGHAELAYYIATRHIGKTNDRVITMAMNEKADVTLGIAMVVNAFRTAFHSVFDGMVIAIDAIKEEKHKKPLHE